MSTLQPRPSINHLLRFSTMYQHQICIGTNEPEPGARQRPRRQVLALSRGWGRAEPRRSHPAADAAGLPSSGRTHRTRAAVVAGLSRTERPRRGCSRDLPPPPRRAGAAPGQDMRNECWTSKNKVVGNPDDGKCLHLFDRGSLQKQ